MNNKFKKTLQFIFIFLIFLFHSIIYTIPLKLLNIDYDTLSYQMQILLSLISSTIVAIFILFIYRKYLKEKIKDYKKNFKEYFDIGFKYWILGLIGMCITNFLIARFSPIDEANNEVLVQAMLKKAPFLVFINAGLVAPFLEEMVFRKALGDIFKSKRIMVLMCGLIFGLIHVVFSAQTPWDYLYVIPYGLLGGAFAYMLALKDNIFISITFHMLHNIILLIFSISLLVIK